MAAILWGEVFWAGGYVLAVGLAVRVIMRRSSVGVTLAWLTLLFLVPYGGAAAYVLFGDLDLGKGRAIRAARGSEAFRQQFRQVAKEHAADVADLSAGARQVGRQVYRSTGIPVVGDNRVELLDDWKSILEEWVEAIGRAEERVLMEFYIWHEGGMAEEVLAALEQAVARGVRCLVLVDSVGSRSFLRGARCAAARRAGVRVVEALPAGFFKALLQRQDTRVHRKIVAIDGRLGYTGSLNLVDARYFKQKAGVGQWVDAMVRLEGPGVKLLESAFWKDWVVDAGEGGEEEGLFPPREAGKPGRTRVQAVLSGPGFFAQATYHTFLTALFSAHHRLVLTTPYFVPDEAVETALVAAARRGVAVTLIVPAKNDSRLVHKASRSHFQTLVEAGVKIAEFEGGLLHTKTILVDDDIALIGSVNLDQRSFWINYELTLAIYDRDFQQRLEGLQQRYLLASRVLASEAWKQRPGWTRFQENIYRLFSPLL